MWYAAPRPTAGPRCRSRNLEQLAAEIGFAYQLGSKTTIRGGIGMYTFPWNVDTYASAGLGNAFTSSGNLTDSTGNVTPVVLLSSDGNTNYQGSKGAAINSLFGRAPTTPEAYNGQAVGFNQYNSPAPLLSSWNFTIQRQLSSSMVAELGYVGSNQSHLPFITDLNQLPEDQLGPNDAAFRPYKFQSLWIHDRRGRQLPRVSNGAYAPYVAGLMFNFNYTWSHMMSNQDSSGWGSLQGATPYQRSYNPMANYGPSNFDIRHMFKGHAAYDLPFGRGRQFANNSKPLDYAIGGWTLFGDFVTQGGSPFTPSMQPTTVTLFVQRPVVSERCGDPTAVREGRPSIRGSTSTPLRLPLPAHSGTWEETSYTDRG